MKKHKITKFTLEEKIKTIKDSLDLYLDICENYKSIFQNEWIVPEIQFRPTTEGYGPSINAVYKTFNTLIPFQMFLPLLTKIKTLENLVDIHRTDIENQLGSMVFQAVFNFDEKKLQSIGFYDLAIQLGLSFIDEYYKKIKGIKHGLIGVTPINFSLKVIRRLKAIKRALEKKGWNEDIRWHEFCRHYLDAESENTIMEPYHFPDIKQHYDYFEELVDKGIKKFNDAKKDEDYLIARDYFKNALNFFNKNKGLKETLSYRSKLKTSMIENFLRRINLNSGLNKSLYLDKPDMVKVLKKFISLSNSHLENWIQSYHELTDFIKKKFNIPKNLKYKGYNSFYKDLQNFHEGTNDLSFKDESVLKKKLWSQGVYNFVMGNHILDFIKILERKQSPGLKEIIAKLYVDYSKCSKNIGYVKKAIKIDKNCLEAHYELAQYYKDNEHQDKAKTLEHLNRLIRSYFLKVDKKDFKKLGGSTHEVGGIGTYLFNDLILKRSKKDLSKEYNLTKLIYDLVLDKRLTSEPITFIKERGGTSYIILKSSDSIEGITLSETLEHMMYYLSIIKGKRLVWSKFNWSSDKEIMGLFKLNCLKQVINSLVRFQNLSPNLEKVINQYDYGAKLQDKLKELFPNTSNEIYNNLSFLVEYLNNLPRQAGHCDFYPKNLLVLTKYPQRVDDFADFCIIDYEKVSKVNRYFDLAYLLEQAQLSLSWEVKKELISYYKEKIWVDTPLEEVMKIYDYNALFINLSLAGTSSRWVNKGKEYGLRKQKYLSQVKETLKRMENNYGLDLEHLNKIF